MSVRVVIKPGGAALVLCVVVGAAALVRATNKPLPLASAPVASALMMKATPILPEVSPGSDSAAQWHFVRATPQSHPESQNGVVRASLLPETPAKMWSNMAMQTINTPLKKNDVLYFRGYFRASKPQAIHVFVEETVSPHRKDLSCDASLGTEWREFQAKGVVKQDFAPGEARLVMHLGGAGGFVDFKGITVSRAAPSFP